MFIVSLVTVGSPDQLTGGYLYHRRMADAASDHDARIDFADAKLTHDPFAAPADVILIDSIAAAVVAPWLGRRRRRDRPLAAILHQPPGGIDHGVLRRVAQSRLDRALYKRCALLLAASAALRDELIDVHGFPPARIQVVAPGRDVAPPPDERRDLRAGRDAALLSVGNWVVRKGTLQLLDAFARLPRGVATLHLVGRHDVEPRYTARVRARLRAPDLAGRVVVHGPVPRDEVAILYASADVFVLTSLREPYGTVYGEAMAAGLPVVGWRAGNLPNLAEHERHGAVLEPGDIDALSDALHRLAVDEPWRRRLADAARRRAEELPTWRESAGQFFDALKRLTPDHG
jgi:glycosyltransferase involved in cell wall biosynthesis